MLHEACAHLDFQERAMATELAMAAEQVPKGWRSGDLDDVHRFSMDFRWIFDRFSMKMLTFEARFYDLARRLLARFRTTRAPGPGDVAHGAAAAGA